MNFMTPTTYHIFERRAFFIDNKTDNSILFRNYLTYISLLFQMIKAFENRQLEIKIFQKSFICSLIGVYWIHDKFYLILFHSIGKICENPCFLLYSFALVINNLKYSWFFQIQIYYKSETVFPFSIWSIPHISRFTGYLKKPVDNFVSLSGFLSFSVCTLRIRQTRPAPHPLTHSTGHNRATKEKAVKVVCAPEAWAFLFGTALCQCTDRHTDAHTYIYLCIIIIYYACGRRTPTHTTSAVWSLAFSTCAHSSERREMCVSVWLF